MSHRSAIPSKHELGADGKIVVRRNAREYLTVKSVSRDLFLHALNLMHNEPDSSSPLSHFQQGAIHGLPYEAFDGDAHPVDPNDTQRWYGYCHHADPLFPTWHRPYVMLYELTIIHYALQYLKGLPNGANYEKVAKDLRLPYLDFAEKEVIATGLPSAFTDDEIEVDFPHTQNISNPLRGYRLPVDIKSEEGGQETIYLRGNEITPRHPRKLAGNTFNESFLELIRLQRWGDFTEDVLELFNTQQSWPHFGSQRSSTRPPFRQNLEALHGRPHVMIGGYGQGPIGGAMSHPEVAGFDPIFFLHHCNVDRQIALWQFLYDPYATDPSKSNEDTEYWLPRRQTQTSDFEDHDGTYARDTYTHVYSETPLHPFRNKDTGRFFTSTEVRWSRDMNTSYPEIEQALLANGVEAQKRAMREILNNKYGQPVTPTLSTPILDTVRERLSGNIVPLSVRPATLASTPSGQPAPPAISATHEPEPPSPSPAVGHPATDILVALKNIPKLVFGGSFFISVYLRLPDKQPILAGSVFVFARKDKRCINCTFNNKVDDVVRISKAVAAAGLIEQDDFPEVVKNKLQLLQHDKLLQLKFTLADGTEFSASSFPQVTPQGTDPIQLEVFQRHSVYARASLTLSTGQFQSTIQPQKFLQVGQHSGEPPSDLFATYKVEPASGVWDWI